MCNFVIECADVEATWNIDFREYFSDALERLERYRDEGLVSIESERIRATPIGELFVRNLAMCFDRYMWEKHADSDKPTFSRTV
jgi:oxygen-independent coproporphyrinogen-3 oxidase